MKPTHALALVFAASATFGLPAQAQQGWWGDGGAWGPFGMFGQGQGPGIMQGWSGGPMPGQGYGMMPGCPQGGQGYGMMPGPMMGGAMMPGRGQFAMVDSDQDGTVSAEEAAAHADTVFSAMDADDDGALTSNEFMAARMGPGAGLNPAMEARMSYGTRRSSSAWSSPAVKASTRASSGAPLSQSRVTTRPTPGAARRASAP